MQSRSKVLIAAFSRSIRDPFVHARNAGLLALAATIEFFTEDDCAGKIMPAICPALLDKEKYGALSSISLFSLLTTYRMVRDQANKTLDLYLHRVRNYSSTMADTALLPPNAVDGSNGHNAARIGTSNDTSWAGWAISSFTNKITAAKGEIQPTTNGSTPVVTEPARPASVPRPVKPSAAESLGSSKLGLHAAAPPMVRASSEQPLRAAAQDLHAEENLDDAWGADAWDDEDQTGQKDEDAFFDATTSPQATPSPAGSPAPAAVPYDDGGEPDFAGWLAAQSKAKAKKPLPKGLTKTKELSTRPAAASRTATAGTMKSSKAPTSTKIIDTKPKDEGQEDGWGDAW
jgi:SCY1-like protein 1